MNVRQLQRDFRARYGGPYRAALATACRMTFGRGLVDTSGVVTLGEVHMDAPDRVEHLASGWRLVQRALRGSTITREDVLVDFGSGMGRAVYVAARHYPFRRVIGVELVPEFNAVAAENVRRMRSKLRCQDVKLVTGDATEFEVPDDMTYAYFFNPFTGELFANVFRNILASLERRPRTITICYANPTQDAVITGSGRFVKVRETAGIRRDIKVNRIAVYRSV
jgi:hypothetical protein